MQPVDYTRVYMDNSLVSLDEHNKFFIKIYRQKFVCNVCLYSTVWLSPVPLLSLVIKKGKRKVQGVPESQDTALPRHQEQEETDKTKQKQIEQTYEKH